MKVYHLNCCFSWNSSQSWYEIKFTVSREDAAVSIWEMCGMLNQNWWWGRLFYYIKVWVTLLPPPPPGRASRFIKYHFDTKLSKLTSVIFIPPFSQMFNKSVWNIYLFKLRLSRKKYLNFSEKEYYSFFIQNIWKHSLVSSCLKWILYIFFYLKKNFPSFELSLMKHLPV